MFHFNRCIPISHNNILFVCFTEARWFYSIVSVKYNTNWRGGKKMTVICLLPFFWFRLLAWMVPALFCTTHALISSKSCMWRLLEAWTNKLWKWWALFAYCHKSVSWVIELAFILSNPQVSNFFVYFAWYNNQPVENKMTCSFSVSEFHQCEMDFKHSSSVYKYTLYISRQIPAS